MDLSQVYEVAEKDQFIGRVYTLQQSRYRLAQISATKKGPFFDLIYSFDKDYTMIHLCVEIDENDTIESISGLYPYSYLYENELKDLFGVKINGMNIDFKGNLYKTSVKTPFKTSER